jgi:hypothetical protein
MTHTVGHVFPIMKNSYGQWQTGPWFLRSERCYLFPGDSAMGYRLPLDSQPWVTKADYPYMNPPDPSQPAAALRSHAEIRRQFERQFNVDGATGSAQQGPAAYAMANRGAELTSDFDGEGDGKASRTDTRPGSKQSAGWITRMAMSADQYARRLSGIGRCRRVDRRRHAVAGDSRRLRATV